LRSDEVKTPGSYGGVGRRKGVPRKERAGEREREREVERRGKRELQGFSAQRRTSNTKAERAWRDKKKPRTTGRLGKGWRMAGTRRPEISFMKAIGIPRPQPSPRPSARAAS
jgi:hypothetical protein